LRTIEEGHKEKAARGEERPLKFYHSKCTSYFTSILPKNESRKSNKCSSSSEKVALGSHIITFLRTFVVAVVVVVVVVVVAVVVTIPNVVIC